LSSRKFIFDYLITIQGTSVQIEIHGIVTFMSLSSLAHSMTDSKPIYRPIDEKEILDKSLPFFLDSN